MASRSGRRSRLSFQAGRAKRRGIRRARDERQHGLAPQRAGSFLVVRVGVVAGDAEQHGRHAQRVRSRGLRRAWPR